MRALIPILFLLIFVSNSLASTITGKVVGVKDGDTIVVLESDAKPITIRLRGIDCPEKRQAFGQRAKQFTSSEVFGKEVRVQTFGAERWGRTIGEVFFGSHDLNIDLLKAGLAWVYTRYAHGLDWEKYERAARMGKFGLWSGKSPTPPWEFRHSKAYSFYRVGR